MTAEDAIAVGSAVDARVQQIPAHQLLGVHDGVGARAELSIWELARLHGARRHNAATGCCRVGLAPPRLIETTGVISRCRTAVCCAAKVVITAVTPTTGPSARSMAITAVAAPTAGVVFLLVFFLFVIFQAFSGFCRIRPSLHFHANRLSTGVEHREDTLRGSFALRIGLRFDGFNVCCARGVELAHCADTRAGLAVGNRDDPVIAHCFGLCVNEVCGDLFTLGKCSRHDATTVRVAPKAALVSLSVLRNSLDRCINPAVHGGTGCTGEAMAVSIGAEAFDSVVKVLQGLLMIPIPRFQSLVGTGSLHERFETFVHR